MGRRVWDRILCRLDLAGFLTQLWAHWLNYCEGMLNLDLVMSGIVGCPTETRRIIPRTVWLSRNAGFQSLALFTEYMLFPTGLTLSAAAVLFSEKAYRHLTFKLTKHFCWQVEMGKLEKINCYVGAIFEGSSNCISLIMSPMWPIAEINTPWFCWVGR